MEDTIAAVATAPGAGGVAIVRVSGPRARDILLSVFKPAGGWGDGPQSHRMVYGRVVGPAGEADRGLAVFFAEPHSYTGQDTAEFHGHSGWRAPRAVLEAALCAGARLAQPGEFTRRAFLCGKVDLSQAEAVMDLVGALAEKQRQVALSQLSGRLRRAVEALEERLTDLLADVEVTIDYPEEDLEAPTAAAVGAALEDVLASLDGLLQTADTGRVYREGLRCALAGRPNVGKSSLLNALAGQDRAIVTEHPGTTRDTLEADIDLKGLRVTLVDTAGIREDAGPVERLGVERARRAAGEADIVLLLLDGSAPVTEEDRALYGAFRSRPHLLVATKADLAPGGVIPAAFPEEGVVPVSALTGEGLPALEEAILSRVMAGGVAAEEVFLSNVRHIDAVGRARGCAAEAAHALAAGLPPELAAEDLREAARALGEVTGRTVDEAVVARIFEKFCVGK